MEDVLSKAKGLGQNFKHGFVEAQTLPWQTDGGWFNLLFFFLCCVVLLFVVVGVVVVVVVVIIIIIIVMMVLCLYLILGSLRFCAVQ